MIESEYFTMLYVAFIMLLLCGCGAAIEWYCNFVNKLNNKNNQQENSHE